MLFRLLAVGDVVGAPGLDFAAKKMCIRDRFMAECDARYAAKIRGAADMIAENLRQSPIVLPVSYTHLGAPPRFFGQDQRNGVEQQHNL